MSLTRKAARGAALLDRKCPDWPTVVDPGTLSMITYDFCVIGQLAPSSLTARSWPFIVKRDRYDLQLEDVIGGWFTGLRARWYGFDLGISGSTDRYTRLTDAWREEILRRRAARVELADAVD